MFHILFANPFYIKKETFCLMNVVNKHPIFMNIDTCIYVKFGNIEIT